MRVRVVSVLMYVRSIFVLGDVSCGSKHSDHGVEQWNTRWQGEGREHQHVLSRQDLPDLPLSERSQPQRTTMVHNHDSSQMSHPE